MKKIGIGLIGCGGMGRALAKRVLEKGPQLEIRGICDPDKRSIQATLEHVSPGAKVYPDHRALLRSPDIDWVMIASWNCFHREHTVSAFRAGKDVFCQKPLATTTNDCLAMYRAWKASGKMFNIGFTLRYSPHYRKLRELIETRAIGDLISMEFNETLDFNHGGYIMGDWRRLTKFAGTHLLEKCCHDVDLVNWMVGSLAKRVASFGGLDFFVPKNARHIKRLGKDSGGRKAYCTWPGLVCKNPFTSDKDIIDNQVAIIEFANGVRSTFHANCNCGIPERRMYICGTEGAIRADVLTGLIELRRIGFDTKIEHVEAGVKGGHGGGDDVLAQELCESMLEGRLPSASLEDGLKSAITCFAIDKAMETGRVVDVTPYWRRAGLL
jgi:predicted dehydrogenase